MSIKTGYRLLREFGLDLRRLSLLAALPHYLRDARLWRRQGGRISAHYPVLGDRLDQAGAVTSAYFLQDLLIARRIHAAQPRRHVDVGSRIDGFVAHVAAFRPIDVIDIRPVRLRVDNIRFIQGDLMAGATALAGTTDSLSCLHALEHFGLGRYGDGIDPQGHLRGFRSLIDMLEPGGTLYLSFPVGRPRVEFNAHRIFGATEVLGWPGSASLELERFDLIDDAGDLHEDIPLDGIAGLGRSVVHGCGIYTFVRRAVVPEAPAGP